MNNTIDFEEVTLNDAKEELACLEACSLDEIANNYLNWKGFFITEAHDAPTPEVRRVYLDCLDLLEQKNREAYEQ